MKIHVAASKSSTTDPKVRLDIIKNTLESLGHNARIDHILNPKSLKDMRDINYQEEYKKIHKRIKSSDVLIADITTPSNGVGHEIFLALDEGKPVLALYAYDQEAPRDVTLRGNPSKLLTTKSYTKGSLPQILEDFCKDAKSKLDTKFILIISPAIDKYLRWASEERRLHKAQVVRKAVEKMMGKDKEYKNYLKSVGV